MRASNKRVLWRRAGRAQGTVEFALIVWPFFLLLLATLDYAQYYFYEHSLRYAVNTAGRFATPGNVLYTNSYIGPGTNKEPTNCPLLSSYSSGAGQWISRYESIRRTFSNNCAIQFSKGMLQTNVKISSWPGPDDSKTEANSNAGPGVAGDFVKISVTYQLKLITPVATLLASNGVYNINMSAIFLNEPSNQFVTYTNYYSGEEN